MCILKANSMNSLLIFVILILKMTFIKKEPLKEINISEHCMMMMMMAKINEKQNRKHFINKFIFVTNLFTLYTV